MEFFEDKIVEKKKKSKASTIAIISIAILLVVTIALIYGIVYLQSTVNKITLDGKNVSELEKILIIEQDESSSKLYFPIRKIASYFGYQDFSGDYKYKTEDQTKCHVTNEFETAMFTLNSSTLVKTRGGADYEYIELDEKVFEKNGELYTTIDGIKKAYNAEISFKPEERKIQIYTMNYLVQYYAQKLGLEDYEAEFIDQKAIFENMLIVEENDKFGVVSATTGNAILEKKYDSVSYLPNTADFLVESNGKYGVVSKEAKIKINIVYDDIEIMDNQNGLYLIEVNNLYGVINSNGKIVIQPEYPQIGINTSNFAQNGIENQYILLNELIPIKNNNLWAFFDKEGKQLTQFTFTGLGCTNAKVASSYPLLVIPSYKIVVVEKNKMYNLIRTDGKEIINGYVLNSTYMKTDTENGVNSYFMTYNGETRNIEEWLASVGE